MRCDRVREKLMAYHDDELAHPDRDRVEEHLKQCPACSRMLEDLVHADRAAGMPDPGTEYWSSFTQRVMASVKDQPIPARMGEKRKERKTGPAFLRFAPALSVALVTVVAAGLYLEGRVKVLPPSDLAPVKAGKAESVAPAPSASVEDATAGPDMDRNVLPEKKAAKFKEKGDVQVAAPALGMEEEKNESVVQAPGHSETSARDEMARGMHYQAKAASVMPASVLYARAESLFRAGDLAEAESLLRRLLDQYPSDPLGGRTSVLLARVLGRLNRPKEAEDVLSRGERLLPGDPDIARFRSQGEAQPEGAQGR